MKNVFDSIWQKIEAMPARSAWAKGVKAYAGELIRNLEDAYNGGYFDIENIKSPELLKKALLNGAQNWKEYSWGGSSLIYNWDIAERLCSPSELKRTHNGDRDPNRAEQWLDTQARALYQAADLIQNIAKNL